MYLVSTVLYLCIYYIYTCKHIFLYHQAMVDVSVTLDFLQGEKHITLGHLLPFIRNLQRNIELKLIDCNSTKSILTELKKAVDSRFMHFFKDRDCILTATVHPR